jgi:hypothetical protein
MDTPNPLNVDLFTNLQNADEVSQGVNTEKLTPTQSFVRKCLHPPSAVPNFCGLPTNDARSQVTIEWRGMQINRTPRIFNSDQVSNNLTAADLNTFNYVFLQTSGGRVITIPFIEWDGGISQDLANGITVAQYDFRNFRNDAVLYRPCYKSLTYCQNATAFSNTGTVACNQFNPSLLFSGSIAELAEQNLSLFCHFLKSKLNDKFNPSRTDLENWDSLPKYARDEFIRRNGLPANHVVGLDPNTPVQIVNLGPVTNPSSGSSFTYVPSQTQILQNSLRSYGGVAKEGVFSVQRLNTIAPTWLTSSRANSADGNAGLYECYVYVVTAAGGASISPLFENTPVGTTAANANILIDTLWSSDMTWSWTRFDGLSLNNQLGTQSQLIIQKFYLGLEVQPTNTSAWSGMLKLAPKPDVKNMQALLDAFYELKDGLPARYNFWGELVAGAAPLITGALKDLGSSIIGGLFGKKNNNNNRKQNNKPKQQQNNRPKQLAIMPPPATKSDINHLEKKLEQMSTNNNGNVGNVSGRRRINNRRRRGRGKGMALNQYMAQHANKGL